MIVPPREEFFASAGAPRPDESRGSMSGAPPRFVRWRRERFAHALALSMRRSSALPELARTLVLGGKKLRSRILFAAAPPVLDDAGEERLLEAAAAIELLHAGSLVHDDVVDRCDLRRGLPAVHAIHGERTAAWAGTWVMYAATALVVRLPTGAQERFAETARAVSRGQLAEILRTHDPSVGVAERLEIMDAKTACVFALACELGGALGGLRAEVVRSLGEIGRLFGLAFQLADDVDDLLAPAVELGRPPGTDVREGVLSLPLVLAGQASGVDCLREIVATAAGCANPLEAVRLRTLLRSHGALQRTQEIGRGILDRARAELRAVRVHGGAHAGVAWIVELLGELVLRIETRMEVADG